VVGHHGEVTHEDLLLLDLARHLVDEGGLHEQGAGEGDVLIPALFLREFLLAEFVTTEIELELLGEVLDRAYLFEDLLDAFIQEPIDLLPLDRDEIW